MGWTAWLAAGLLMGGAAPPSPVVAPKPVSARASCPQCRPLPVWRAIRRLQGGPELALQDTMPERLPPAEDAAPLPPTDASPALRALLDRYLPSASAEERSVWADELRDLPPEVARDFLAARRQAGVPEAILDLPADGLVPPPQYEPALPEPAGLPAIDIELIQIDRETTLKALRSAEAAILHNIANADTVAFRRLEVLTADSPSGGVGELTLRPTHVQGPLRPTGRSLDLAINGPGYFRIALGEATALTRRGMLHLTGDRELAIRARGEEWKLDPPARMPDEAIDLVVTEDGGISCRMPGGGILAIGQIELLQLADDLMLEPIGGGVFIAGTDDAVQAGPPGRDGLGRIRQGHLERSNVDLPDELQALSRLRQQLAALQELPTQLASPAEVTDLAGRPDEARGQ
jgi:flagellar basal body rod protein FlgG